MSLASATSPHLVLESGVAAGQSWIQVALEARRSYSVPTDPEGGGGLRKQDSCVLPSTRREAFAPSRMENCFSHVAKTVARCSGRTEYRAHRSRFKFTDSVS